MPVNLKDFKGKTLEEAVEFLYSGIDESEKKYMLENGTDMLHHGAGTAIRNEWGLWQNSELAQHFKSVYKLGHADDMSGMIFAALEAKLKGEVFDPAPEVARYHNHWSNYGVDPVTMKKVK